MALRAVPGSLKEYFGLFCVIHTPACVIPVISIGQIGYIGLPFREYVEKSLCNCFKRDTAKK
jgi:hypothetical protein